MPDDCEIYNDMLEQVTAMEEKLGKLKSAAKSRAIVERLRKLREDLTKLSHE